MLEGEGMVRALEKELLSAEDVAALMGVKETTVWRWCREGTLPCLKVGKHWRVRREAFEDFLKRSERSTTLVGQLSSFLQVPDNVLVIAQNLEILHRLDAAFFRVGEAHEGLLVKFYGGEVTSEEELRADFERNGLDVRRLERDGRLLMRPEEDPAAERMDELKRLLDEEGVGFLRLGQTGRAGDGPRGATEAHRTRRRPTPCRQDGRDRGGYRGVACVSA
jgi:excisionase family DNA binding protein